MKRFLILLVSVMLLTTLTVIAFAEQRTLSILHWRTEDKDAYQELIRRYEEAHPDVNVEMEIIATGEYDTSLLMRLQGGVVADVFATHLGGSFVDNVSTGNVLDMAGYESITSNYTPDAMSYFNMDGAQYAAPQTTNALAVYYNKAIFAQYGLEVPKTLEEFENVCKVLSENGVVPMAFAAGETWLCTPFLSLLVANCVEDDKIWFKIADGEATFQTDPGFAEAVSFVRKLREAGYILPESSGLSEESMLTGFAIGKYGMISTGTWSMSTVRNIDSTCDFGVFNMPGTLGIERGISFIGLSWCINKNSPVLQDAIDFAAYMSSPEAVSYLCDQTGQLTPVSNVTLTNPDLDMALALLSTKDGFASAPYRVYKNAAYDIYSALAVEAVTAETFDVAERLAYYQGEIDKLNK